MRSVLSKLPALLVLVIGWGLSGTVLAQTQTGQILVYVTDQGGAAMPGVRLELTGRDLQGSRVLTTNEEGEARFLLLPPGSAYQVVATGEGMAPFTTKDRSVTMGKVTAV